MLNSKTAVMNTWHVDMEQINIPMPSTLLSVVKLTIPLQHPCV